jgi:hypothetical protein
VLHKLIFSTTSWSCANITHQCHSLHKTVRFLIFCSPLVPLLTSSLPLGLPVRHGGPPLPVRALACEAVAATRPPGSMRREAAATGAGAVVRGRGRGAATRSPWSTRREAAATGAGTGVRGHDRGAVVRSRAPATGKHEARGPPGRCRQLGAPAMEARRARPSDAVVTSSSLSARVGGARRGQPRRHRPPCHCFLLTTSRPWQD